MSLSEQADGDYGGEYHKYLKKSKNRCERRKAKEKLKNPETEDIPDAYGKYNGYES